MAAKKQTKVQKKKKKWVPIKAPRLFKDANLGESPVFDPENLVGRSIKVNLMSLTRDPKKQNINVMFRITKIETGVAITEIQGYEFLASTLKRLIKRRKEKVDDSFVVKTKDNKLVRVKPLIITNGKTNNSTLTAIRGKTRWLIASKFKKMNLEEFIGEILTGKILRLKDDLKKVYPVKTFEIRSIRIEKRKATPINADDYKVAAPKKEESEDQG